MHKLKLHREDDRTYVFQSSDGSNHTTQIRKSGDNDTNLSMTDKTANDSLEEGFDVNQDDDDGYNSMTTEIVDDNLKANVEEQSNEEMLSSSSTSIHSSQSHQPSNSSELAVGKKKAQGNSNRKRKSTSQPQRRLNQTYHKDEVMLNNFIRTLAKKKMFA